jgi:hypothetical protein
VQWPIAFGTYMCLPCVIGGRIWGHLQ